MKRNKKQKTKQTDKRVIQAKESFLHFTFSDVVVAVVLLLLVVAAGIEQLTELF